MIKHQQGSMLLEMAISLLAGAVFLIIYLQALPVIQRMEREIEAKWKIQTKTRDLIYLAMTEPREQLQRIPGLQIEIRNGEFWIQLSTGNVRGLPVIRRTN